MPVYTEEEKGEPIRFVGGKYAVKGTRTGWFLRGGNVGPEKVDVLVDNGDGTVKKTSVFYTSVEKQSVPKTYLEAALAQHGDINSALNKVCKSLAQLDFHDDEKDLHETIYTKIAAAHGKLEAKGNKKHKFTVEWKEDKDKEDERRGNRNF